MKTSKLVGLLGWLFITLPIYLYLLYKILEAVQATELMWFLYWAYLISATILGLIVKLTDDK